MFYRNKNKTVEYRKYQDTIKECLKDQKWSFSDRPLFFDIQVGLSSKLADLDNTIKPILDTYQFVYKEFNDKNVYKIHMEKNMVEKGKEYLYVTIQSR